MTKVAKKKKKKARRVTRKRGRSSRLSNAEADRFVGYLNTELSRAAKEINELKENNRKHIQKLLYTNMVDRFDSLLDELIIENALSPQLLEMALSSFTKPAEYRQLVEYILDPSTVRDRVIGKIKSNLETKVRHAGHAKKVKWLCDVYKEDGLESRVDENEGKIRKKRSPSSEKIPTSIVGYADWLYVRRSAIVHGGGSIKIGQKDKLRLIESYGVKPATSVKISMSSIQNCITFYSELLDIWIPKMTVKEPSMTITPITIDSDISSYSWSPIGADSYISSLYDDL